MALIQREGIWHVRKMVNGIMLAKSTKTTNKRQAEQIEAKWVAELVQNVLVAGQAPVTLARVMTEFLAPRVALKSYGMAVTSLKKFEGFKQQYFKDIKTTDIDKLMQDLRKEGAAESSLNLYVTYWNSLVNFAIKRKYAPAERASKIKNVKGKIRFLTNDEQQKLLDALKPENGKQRRSVIRRQSNYDLVVALLDTGARYSEITNMHWHQVNFETNTVLINRQKNGHDTSLTMSKRLREIMVRRAANVTNDQFVFPDQLSINVNRKWVKQAVTAAGLSEEAGSITLHTCRHTFASHMLQNGMDLASVSHLLGHKNITSTMVYAHLVTKDVANKAADIMNRLAA